MKNSPYQYFRYVFLKANSTKRRLMVMGEEVKKSLIKLKHWTRLHQEQLIE